MNRPFILNYFIQFHTDLLKKSSNCEASAMYKARSSPCRPCHAAISLVNFAGIFDIVICVELGVLQMSAVCVAWKEGRRGRKDHIKDERYFFMDHTLI